MVSSMRDQIRGKSVVVGASSDMFGVESFGGGAERQQETGGGGKEKRTWGGREEASLGGNKSPVIRVGPRPFSSQARKTGWRRR